MLVLNANITIESEKTWVFDKVADVKVVRDAESLTDTCAITLPSKVKWKGERKVPISSGDPVTVELGYDGRLATVFRGYVTAVGARSPVTIRCEDEMWKLKSAPAVPKAYREATLTRLLEDQSLGVEYRVCGEENLGMYRVTSATAAGMLARLGERGIRSFFRCEGDRRVLYVGALFDAAGERAQVFDDARNIVGMSDLKYYEEGELKALVKATSIDGDNRVLSATAGDAGGQEHVFKTYGKTQEQLQKWAEQQLAALKRSGLSGSLDTFGAVVLDKLDTVGVVLGGEKKGLYQVKKNTITYGAGGFRQKVGLGRRID